MLRSGSRLRVPIGYGAGTSVDKEWIVDESNSGRNRLRVLDALLLTLDHREEFDALLWLSADRAEAIDRR